MSIVYGIPKRAAQAAAQIVEKYPNSPVMTIQPAPEEAGKYSKLHFNPTALAQLGLDFEADVAQYISFNFGETSTSVINVTADANCPDDAKYKIYKNGNVSNKRMYEFLNNRLDGSEFLLTASDANADGVVLHELSPVVNEESSETYSTMPEPDTDEVPENDMPFAEEAVPAETADDPEW